MHPASGCGNTIARRRYRTSVFALYLVTTLATFLASLAAIEPALAQCSTSGNTETCTGNLSTGVAVSAPPDNLVVNSLTTNIAPASTAPGLSLSSQGGGGSGASGDGGSGHDGSPGDNISINYSGPPQLVITGGSGGEGIIATSTGGSGSGELSEIKMFHDFHLVHSHRSL
jgi:hypothetical protein